MDTLIAEVTRLTDDWYLLIRGDHHKDRDCHWYIETAWSYGYSPRYTVHHNGYLLKDLEEEFCSYEKALLGLKNVLTQKIKEYKEEKGVQENEESGW